MACKYGTIIIFTVACCAMFVSSVALAQTSKAMQSTQARQGIRMDQLENEIRRLTGQNESLNHQLTKIEEGLKILQDQVSRMAERKVSQEDEPKARKDGFVERLNEQSLDSLGSVPSEKEQVDEEQNAKKSPRKEVPGSGKGTKVLGVLRTNEPGQTAKLAVDMKLTPGELYQKAHDLIIKDRNIPKAELLLTTFLERNPKHHLTPNAYYWLGRTHFVRRDFQKAAFAFAEGFQKFPKSEKAPANLLSLGRALAGLGKKKEACTTLLQLTQSYPKASAAVKRRVRREQRQLKCRKL